MQTGLHCHPAQDTIRGLAGRVFHDDYVSRIASVELLGDGCERISCEVRYDPVVRRARLTLPFTVTVIAPSGLQDYRPYQLEVLYRLKRAQSLTDVRLPATGGAASAVASRRARLSFT